MTIYDKPLANILHNGEKLRIFFSKITNITRMSTLTNFIQHNFAIAIREEKEIKGIKIGKEEVKFSLFADDVILQIEVPKDATRKPLGLINEFGKVAGNKINREIYCISTH